MTQLTPQYFDAKKAGQLVYYFLHRADQQAIYATVPQMSAWLYLAERAVYETLGAPLTGDQLVATRQGPVLATLTSALERLRSEEASFLQGIAQAPLVHGDTSIECARRCMYSCIDELGKFSDAEVEVLDDIWRMYGRWSAAQLRQHLCNTEAFPECRLHNDSTCVGIELETLLKAVGFEGQQVGHLVDAIVGFAPVDAWPSPTAP